MLSVRRSGMYSVTLTLAPLINRLLSVSSVITYLFPSTLCNINCVLLINNIALENTFNEGPILRQNIENRMTLSGTVILKLNAGDKLKLQAATIEDITYSRARIDIEKIA